MHAIAWIAFYCGATSLHQLQICFRDFQLLTKSTLRPMKCRMFSLPVTKNILNSHVEWDMLFILQCPLSHLFQLGAENDDSARISSSPCYSESGKIILVDLQDVSCFSTTI